MKALHPVLLLIVFLCHPLLAQMPDEAPPLPDQEEPEVLTSGPVHEAYAEPVELQPEPGIVVSEEPPPRIDEELTEERPAGNHVWVPGYWAWEADRERFVWVSGCWRTVPPRMNWVPGYWTEVPGGWQWIEGFWSRTAPEDPIKYLPEPPVLEDLEPPAGMVSAEGIWVPPCWYWNSGRYVLRSGYWLTPQPNWIWVPSHYVWTPRGHVFVRGYWDHVLTRRGVLFAPVYVPRHVRVRPGYSLSLSVVLDVGHFEFGLFTYPRYRHYYFGDYYDDVYVSIGIYPWFECATRRTWYDPIYAHRRWHHHRHDPHWDRRLHDDYRRRRADPGLRPPRTYREMERRIAVLPERQRDEHRIARPFSETMAGRGGRTSEHASISGGRPREGTDGRPDGRGERTDRRVGESRPPASVRTYGDRGRERPRSTDTAPRDRVTTELPNGRRQGQGDTDRRHGQRDPAGSDSKPRAEVGARGQRPDRERGRTTPGPSRREVRVTPDPSLPRVDRPEPRVMPESRPPRPTRPEHHTVRPESPSPRSDRPRPRVMPESRPPRPTRPEHHMVRPEPPLPRPDRPEPRVTPGPPERDNPGTAGIFGRELPFGSRDGRGPGLPRTDGGGRGRGGQGR